MEFEREQIKKQLVLFIDDMPVELHLHSKKTAKFLSFLKSVLAIITTDEQKIKELEAENEQLKRNLGQCENGYKQQLHLTQMLLRGAYESVEQKDKLLETFKATTVKKMREAIVKYYSQPKYQPTSRSPIKHTMIGHLFTVIDQIAKEILEGDQNDDNT